MIWRNIAPPAACLVLAGLASFAENEQGEPKAALAAKMGSAPGGPRRVGEFLALEGDLHAHSIYAGSLASPIDIVLLARFHHLDFVAVTGHNSIFGAKIARQFAEWFSPDVIVLTGQEVTTRGFHLLGVGIEEAVDGSLPISDVARSIRAQGGAVILAHPVRAFWERFWPLVSAGGADGMEVMHPIALVNRPGSTWRGEDLTAFYERALAAGRVVSAVGASDYHGLNYLGVCRTTVLVRERSAASIVEALREGRAFTFKRDGSMVGPPAVLAQAKAHDYRQRGSQYGYAARTTVGAVCTILCLGVLGLGLVLRRYN